MTFTVGGVDVTAVHVGPTAAVAVYLGADKVWPKPTAQLLLFDSFSRHGGTLLTGQVTEIGGAAWITGEAHDSAKHDYAANTSIYRDQNDKNALNMCDTGLTSYSVRALHNPSGITGTPDRAYLIFRNAADPHKWEKGWMFQVDSRTNVLRLYNGTTQVGGEVPAIPGETTLRVDVTPTSIDCYENDVWKIGSTDHSWASSTHVGVRLISSGSQPSNTFDDFTVYTL